MNVLLVSHPIRCGQIRTRMTYRPSTDDSHVVWMRLQGVERDIYIVSASPNPDNVMPTE